MKNNIIIYEVITVSIINNIAKTYSKMVVIRIIIIAAIKHLIVVHIFLK